MRNYGHPSIMSFEDFENYSKECSLSLTPSDDEASREADMAAGKADNEALEASRAAEMAADNAGK
jgi:hypothetical protein